MKIRNKITLLFVLLAGSLLFGIFVFVYYFAYHYTENEFFLRLKERTNIVAQSYLEKDELSAHIYNEIIQKHLQKLPDEQEQLIKVDIPTRTIEKDSAIMLPKNFINDIFTDKYAQMKVAGTYFSGLLYPDNQGDFIIVVSANNKYGTAMMIDLRNVLVIALFWGLGAIFIIGRYYAGKVLNPITEITEKANNISVSNLHLRLQTGKNKDELNQLAVTFNKMLERLEIAFEMQNNFVNNASHELRTPLTAILGEIEITLNRQRSPEEYRESLNTIEKEAHRLDLLVNSLLKLAQADTDEKGLLVEPIRIDALLENVKSILDNTNPGNRVTIDFNSLPYHSEALVIQGNQNLLNIAINNILDNACKFSKNNQVFIKISTEEKQVSISIKDQGVGIPADDLNNVSVPFFRASNAREFKGFGVGLALALKIIKLHGGTMSITSELMKGTEVKIIFPNRPVLSAA